MIELSRVVKRFGPQTVLDGVDLVIPSGRTTVIIGASGGGKSVLLKHLIGLVAPDEGTIVVDGTDVGTLSSRGLATLRKRFGMLFQEAALFDSMTVGENVAFPLVEHTRKKKREIREIVAEKLALVGLSGAEDKLPSQLSGGMKKRVGLARAIALDPSIILFDEPTTGLDPIMSDAIDTLIIETQKRTGATCVVISHDLAGAFKVADFVAMLHGGRIIESGPPDAFQKSADPVVRQFLEGRATGPVTVV